MGTFTEPLRRNAVTISLSLVLALGVAYYVLGYLPSREAYLRARYFRVVERIGVNIQEKTRAFGKRGEAMVMQIRYEVYRAQDSAQAQGLARYKRPAALGRLYDSTAKALGAQWRAGGLNTPEFDHLERSPTPFRRGELLAVNWQAAVQRLQFEHGFEDSLRLFTTSTSEDFVRDLLRPDAFEHFLILGPQSSGPGAPVLNQVYFSTFPAPPVLGLAGGDPKHALRWLRDTTGLQAARQADFAIGGRPYKLFVEPLRLDGGVTWLLCGAVPAEQFNAECRALPSGLLEAALVFILLAILAMPFLKIVLMGPRERLNRFDVVLCGLALVLATTFLMLVALSPLAKYSIEPELLDGQLVQLADSVQNSLTRELHTLDGVLAGLDKEVAQPKAQAAVRTQENRLDWARRLRRASPAKEDFLPADFLPPKFFSTLRGAGRSWQPEDRVQWLDDKGKSILAIDKSSVHFIASLKERPYFKQVQGHRLWRLDPARARPDSFALASVVRNGRSGEKAAVFARPSRAVLGTGRARALIYSTRLRSLNNTVLPPGYSFCVIDATGEVLFHSDARLSLSENLFTDCEPVGLLQSAVFARASLGGVVQYQGRYHQLRIQPLGEWPLYLVTLADLRPVEARQTQTLSMAATLLSLLGFVQLLSLGLYILVLPRAYSLLAMSYSLRRLWPSQARTLTYEEVAAAMVGGAGLLFAAACFVSELTQLFMLLLLPLYSFLFGFYKMRLPTDNPAPEQQAPTGLRSSFAAVRNLLASAGALRRVLWLTTGFAAFYNLSALYWVSSEWAWGVGFQVAFLGLLVLVPGAARALHSRFGPHLPAGGRPVGDHNSYRRLNNAYAAMLLGWVLVLSVVPAIYCYHIAYRAERELQIRYAHLHLAKALRTPGQEAQQKRAFASERSQLTAYLPFFFRTSYDSVYRAGRSAPRPGDAEVNFRALISALHPAYDTLMRRDTRHVLPLDSGSAQQWVIEWGWLKDTRLTSTYPGPTGRSARLVSEVKPLYWGRHWFWPTYLLRKGEFTTAHFLAWCRFLGLLAAVLVSLYLLLYLLARRVFNLNLLPLKSLVRHSAAVRYAALGALARHEYRLCPTESTYPPPWPAGAPDALRLDCRALVPGPAGSAPAVPAEWQQRVALHLAAQGTPVVLEYFEHRPHDLAHTELKTTVLEYLLLQTAHRLVVVSRVHPTVFADCGHARESCPDKDKHEIIWQTGDRLLDALADFDITYVIMQLGVPLLPYAPWHDRPHDKQLFQAEKQAFLHKLAHTAKAGAPAPNHALRPDFLRLRWFVKAECAALPFLGAPMETQLEKLLLESYGRGRLLREDDLILCIQRQAEFLFRQLWETLTPHEHYVLYDLAQDGLVNGRDTLIIYDLLRKGLLIYDQAGLRLVSESFRSFVLTGLPPQHALRIEREAEQEATREGAWASRSFPIFLLLAAAALFLFVTQRGVLSQAQTFLTALTATLPLLYRFLSFTPFSGGAAPAGGKSGAT